MYVQKVHTYNIVCLSGSEYYTASFYIYTHTTTHNHTPYAVHIKHKYAR